MFRVIILNNYEIDIDIHIQSTHSKYWNVAIEVSNIQKIGM